MKLIAVLIILCTLFGTASALSLPRMPSFFHPAATDLAPVASFEGGQRFSAGDYPVIVLSGSYRQMGRQYGSLMKAELNEEYAFILSSLQKRGYTQEEVRSMGREAVVLYPQRLREVFTGMAETSGLTADDILVLYNGAILYLGLPPVQPSCSYLAAWGNYTTDGSVVASRNWDLEDVMLPFNDWNVLAVYRPSDGSNGVATFGPAGVRPETLMNSKGLFIADDNAGFVDIAPDTRPDLVSEFFRFMLDYSDLKGLDAGLRGARTNIAWIVDVAGPEGAYVYEVITQRYTAEDRRRGRGRGQSLRRPGLEHVSACRALARPLQRPPPAGRGGKGIDRCPKNDADQGRPLGRRRRNVPALGPLERLPRAAVLHTPPGRLRAGVADAVDQGPRRRTGRRSSWLPCSGVEAKGTGSFFPERHDTGNAPGFPSRRDQRNIIFSNIAPPFRCALTPPRSTSRPISAAKL